MTSEDFSQFAKVYGADIKRWPEEHRPMIADLATTQFSTMRQILDEELALDTLLNQSIVAPASPVLFDSIIQSAPQAKSAKHQTNFWQDSDWLIKLFKMLGFTSVGLAGALTGIMFVSIMSSQLAISNNESVLTQVVDFGQDWR